MALDHDQTERVVALALDLARAGETTQLAEFIEHGVPVDVCDSDANTLLMLAAYHGRPDTVRMLIGAGADVNLRNARDQSPVAGALFKGEREVVDVLVAAGADLDAGTPTAPEAAQIFGQEL